MRKYPNGNSSSLLLKNFLETSLNPESSLITSSFLVDVIRENQIKGFIDLAVFKNLFNALLMNCSSVFTTFSTMNSWKGKILCGTRKMIDDHRTEFSSWLSRKFSVRLLTPEIEISILWGNKQRNKEMNLFKQTSANRVEHRFMLPSIRFKSLHRFSKKPGSEQTFLSSLLLSTLFKALMSMTPDEAEFSTNTTTQIALNTTHEKRFYIDFLLAFSPTTTSRQIFLHQLSPDSLAFPSFLKAERLLS